MGLPTIRYSADTTVTLRGCQPESLNRVNLPPGSLWMQSAAHDSMGHLPAWFGSPPGRPQVALTVASAALAVAGSGLLRIKVSPGLRLYLSSKSCFGLLRTMTVTLTLS